LNIIIRFTALFGKVRAKANADFHFIEAVS